MRILLLLMVSMFVVSCSHGKYKGYRGHHKHMWKQMDANGDGAVTKAEFDAAHAKKFAEMDANSDGKITKEEKKAYKKKKWKDHCKSKGKDCKDGQCSLKGKDCMKCAKKGGCEKTECKDCGGHENCGGSCPFNAKKKGKE